MTHESEETCNKTFKKKKEGSCIVRCTCTSWNPSLEDKWSVNKFFSARYHVSTNGVLVRLAQVFGVILSCLEFKSHSTRVCEFHFWQPIKKKKEKKYHVSI